MLLLFDIGNTSVTYGVYQGNRSLKFGSCLYNDIPKLVKNWSRSGVFKNDFNIVIGSVVPKNTLFLKKILSKKGGKTWTVGKNLPIPVPHRYSSKRKLGIDRIINIYGGLQMVKPPFLIIDYGTAITFDYVSKKGVFEGGMIVPGPEVAFQALIERAALLPKKLRLPKKSGSFLGRTTYDCMSSGIFEGYGAMTDGLVARFRNRYGKNLRVIATGGFAMHLKPYAASLKRVDPRHSIKSLFLLFKNEGKGL